MNLRSFEVMQQVDFLPKHKIELAVNKPAIKDWAYILHDKDVDDSGNPKKAHWHIICRLKHPQDLKYIAKWFDVEDNYVNKIKGKFSDACKYLIHENAPKKYQYPIENIETNFDYVIEKDRGRSGRLQEILDLITSGEARDYNITDFVKNYEFVKYGTAIKRAFEYRRKLILKGDKDMDVIFITGTSGVGKTTYAKEMATKKKMSYFVAGGSRDPFDGYAGQDCVILDDLRPEEHHISDLLKMTDNHTASLVSSRYFNKVINEVKLMIITSVQTIDQFYKIALHSEPELAVQLCRRVFGYMKMKEKEIIISMYNQKSGRYDEKFVLPNLVNKVYANNEAEQKKKIDDLKSILLGVGQGLEKTVSNIEDYIEPEEVEKPPKKQSSIKRKKASKKRK